MPPVLGAFPARLYAVTHSHRLPHNMSMDYAVLTKATEEGYSAWVPGLPGCWSEGASEAEALENIQEAITDYLAVTAARMH